MSNSDDTAKDKAKMLAGMDQAGAMVSESLPPIMHGFYTSLIGQGFSEDQAMQLTEVFMLKLLGAYQ